MSLRNIHRKSLVFGNGLLQLAAITDAWGAKLAIFDNNAFRLPIDAIRQTIKEDKNIFQKGQIRGIVDNVLSGISEPATSEELYKFADQLEEKLSQVTQLIKADWDIIGISALVTQYKYVKQIIPICREESPDALIVGGGGLFSSLPLETLHWLPDLNLVCIGESYITWQEILEHYEDRNWKKIKGLAYRQGKKTKLTKMRPLIPEEKLDEKIPWPAYEFSPVETYLMNSRIPYSPESMHPSCRRLDICTSYGCNWTCNFCFHPSCVTEIYGKKLAGKPFRQHSPEYIVGLINHLRQQYCINFVSFIDENMTINREWFFKFCEQLEESGLATLIHWGMVCHVRTVDTELLQKGRDVGLSYVSYGGETSSPKLLKQIGKGQNKEQMEAAIQATQAAGVNPIMSFMIGLPDTTVNDLIRDLQFYIDNQIHVKPFFVQPLPGSRLYREFKDKIVEQYLTDEEKNFIEGKSYEVEKIFDNIEKQFSRSRINKHRAVNSAILKDAALERWVLSLDDATKLTVNLTSFNDVELAGLQYMLSTQYPDLTTKMWDLKRLQAFKELKEKENNELE